MSLLGYFHVREVDAFRYKIYRNNNIDYVDYKNNCYKINLPQKFKNLNDIHIVLSKAHYYDDYEKEKQNNFEYIYINDEKIKNDNIIKINLI
jgi:hypothetical protein